MRNRRTRLRLAPLALVAAALVLGGCGGSSSTPSAGGPTLGVDSVKVSGHVGSAATVTFSGQVTDPTSSTKVLVPGNGAKVKQGDQLILQTVIADGYTQKTVASSYTDHQPQVVALTDQVSPIFAEALLGRSIGSRVLVYTSADKVFGSAGDPQLGISNKDVVLILFDIVGQPKTHVAPDWAPKITTSNGVVSGLDFGKTAKPDGKLREAVLTSGTGPKVKKGQTIYVRSLGAVYGGKKPFDESFSSPSPSPYQIGVGGVIAGWDKTLVGDRVGSEVILQIPPKDGYGKQAKPGIPANSTLYFVVDIVGAA